MQYQVWTGSGNIRVAYAIYMYQHQNKYTLLHGLVCHNCDMHTNECNKVFIIHYHNSVVSLLNNYHMEVILLQI